MTPREPDPQTAAVRRFLDPSYVPLCKTLGDVRDNIDRIDAQIVGLLAERGRYVKDAARFKRDAYQVSAPARQEQVLGKVKALAEQTGAYPEVVEAVYRAMMAGFIAREQGDHQGMADVEGA